MPRSLQRESRHRDRRRVAGVPRVGRGYCGEPGAGSRLNPITVPRSQLAAPAYLQTGTASAGLAGGIGLRLFRVSTALNAASGAPLIVVNVATADFRSLHAPP